MLNLHTPGAKDDAEKTDWSYLVEYFPNAVKVLGTESDSLFIKKNPVESLAEGDLRAAIGKTAEELQSTIDSNPAGYFVNSPFATALTCYPDALKEVCKVSMEGAIKYTRGGWKHVENGINRYTAAYIRHWLDRNISGETHSKDLGLLHLSHELWNLMAVYELKLHAKTE